MRRSHLLLALLMMAPPCALAAKPVAPPPALELGESRPLETKLGNRALPEARDEWLDMIRGAKGMLDIEEFYFSHHPGQSLQPVVDEIGRAAARGVHVRLLLDAGFLKTYPQPAESLSHLPYVEMRPIDYKRLTGGVQHAKFMIVDGYDAWIGSQNLDWRSLTQIHELGMRVRHEAIAGAIESIAAILAVKNDIVPPTINHFTDDPEIDSRLNFTFNKAQERVINAALTNTFGFGGHNASIIFKKFKE